MLIKKRIGSTQCQCKGIKNYKAQVAFTQKDIKQDIKPNMFDECLRKTDEKMKKKLSCSILYPILYLNIYFFYLHISKFIFFLHIRTVFGIFGSNKGECNLFCILLLKMIAEKSRMITESLKKITSFCLHYQKFQSSPKRLIIRSL